MDSHAAAKDHRQVSQGSPAWKSLAPENAMRLLYQVRELQEFHNRSQFCVALIPRSPRRSIGNTAKLLAFVAEDGVGPKDVAGGGVAGDLDVRGWSGGGKNLDSYGWSRL
jgi:hypothetical protein